MKFAKLKFDKLLRDTLYNIRILFLSQNIFLNLLSYARLKETIFEKRNGCYSRLMTNNFFYEGLLTNVIFLAAIKDTINYLFL